MHLVTPLMLFQQDFCFALSNDEQMVMLVGVQFGRPTAIKVDICHSSVNNVADGPKQFLCTEIHVNKPTPTKRKTIPNARVMTT